MSVIIFPDSALTPSTVYYTDIIGGGIGPIVVTTGGGNSANVGDPTGKNDDGFCGPLPLGFSFTFFGNTYTEYWINNNGNISFGGGISEYTPTGPQGALQPIISPYFADVDTRGALCGVVHLRTDIPDQIIVTWDQVGYFSTRDDLLNSFQLVLRGPGYAFPPGEGAIGFFYKTMIWEAGSASGGTNGFGGTEAAVGFGDGASNGVVLQSSLTPGIAGVVQNHKTWFDANLVPVDNAGLSETVALSESVLSSVLTTGAGTVSFVKSLDLRHVWVQFTAGVNPAALETQNYTFTAQAVPSFNPTVLSARFVNSKGVVTNSVVELYLENCLSPGLEYELAVAAFSGTPSATGMFTAFAPNWPPTRVMNLWDFVPTINKVEDYSQHLERFILCIQDQLDTTLTQIDNWVNILDPDLAPEAFLDLMLQDLGNPFAFEDLTEADKRLLAKALVRIYKLKGTDQGIEAAVRFFLGFDSQVNLYRNSGSLLSDLITPIDLLDDSFVLGGGGPYDFTLTVATTEAPGRALTATERSRIEKIVQVVRPAFAHFTPPVFYGLAAPDSVQISGSNPSVTISWAQTTTVPTYWRVYYRLTTPGVSPFNSARYEQVAGSTTTKTIATPVGSDPSGSTYYFALVPYYGTSEGLVSEVEVRNNLPAPTSVIATGGVRSVVVSWTATLGATSYRVYKRLAGASTPIAADFVFDVLDGETSYLDSGILPGQTVYYCVVAVVGQSEGYYSSSVSGTAT
jgi:phage tail-like protein